MTFSIIIPTFNSGAVLSRALDSIVNQTFTDWEILIMDSASTDNTIEVAQSYNDSRIQIYSGPDKGIYDAMNKGIKKAQGEWLYFLGSDDYLLNEKVFDAIFSYPIEKYDVVYGDVEAKQLNTLHHGEWNMSNINYNRCHQGIFYRNTIFDKIGLYNLDFPIWADYDLNLRWFFSKKIHHLYLPIIIAHYSDGGYSSHQQDEAFLRKVSLIKLRLGYKCFGRGQKKLLIDDALEQTDNIFIRTMLIVWKTYLVFVLKVRKIIK